jgi:hypothetical protein
MTQAQADAIAAMMARHGFAGVAVSANDGAGSVATSAAGESSADAAEALRLQGNALYVAGQHEEAEALYAKAIATQHSATALATAPPCF